jgi:hypothetical protein
MTFRKNAIFVVVDESARGLVHVDAPQRFRTIRNSQPHLGEFLGIISCPAIKQSVFACVRGVCGAPKDCCRPKPDL